MKSSFENRHACSPAEVEKMNTEQLRAHFLIEKIFEPGVIHLTHTHYDRFITGGAMPVSDPLQLPNPDALKAGYFLERREMGIINVGGTGSILADGAEYKLDHKEALYLGSGTKVVQFLSAVAGSPAKFYINAAPAHQRYPSKKIKLQDAEKVQAGAAETANLRMINKLIVQSVTPVCQLQMGMTELQPGSIWNTMPPHTHSRRMEVYFYFDIPAAQAVCHFMGEPDETRHIWVHNEQAVISPYWSIHSGAGTASYTFIWGMAGENLDYGDMDGCSIAALL